VHLSVVSPVRNEAENILPLLVEIHAALEGRGEFEVVYVDDGSSDATAARLAEAQKLYPRLRVLAHAESCGQSAALVTGFRVARGSGSRRWTGTGRTIRRTFRSWSRRGMPRGVSNYGMFDRL